MLSDKRQADLDRHLERLQALYGNEDATSSAVARYEESRVHRCREVREEARTRRHTLDLSYSGLDYERRLMDLLALEARAMCEGNVHVIGEYDCIAFGDGVEGEDELHCMEELSTLLNQLIYLLENPSSQSLSQNNLTQHITVLAGQSPSLGDASFTSQAHAAASNDVPVALTGHPSNTALTREYVEIQRRAPLTSDLNVVVLDSANLSGL